MFSIWTVRSRRESCTTSRSPKCSLLAQLGRIWVRGIFHPKTPLSHPSDAGDLEALNLRIYKFISDRGGCASQPTQVSDRGYVTSWIGTSKEWKGAHKMLHLHPPPLDSSYTRWDELGRTVTVGLQQTKKVRAQAQMRNYQGCSPHK